MTVSISKIAVITSIPGRYDFFIGANGNGCLKEKFGLSFHSLVTYIEMAQMYKDCNFSLAIDMPADYSIKDSLVYQQMLIRGYSVLFLILYYQHLEVSCTNLFFPLNVFALIIRLLFRYLAQWVKNTHFVVIPPKLCNLFTLYWDAYDEC